MAEIYKFISTDGGLDLLDRDLEEDIPGEPIIEEEDKPF